MFSAEEIYKIYYEKTSDLQQNLDNHACEFIVDAAEATKQKTKRKPSRKRQKGKTTENVNSSDKQHGRSSSDYNIDNDTHTAIESINRSETQPGDPSGLGWLSIDAVFNGCGFRAPFFNPAVRPKTASMETQP